MSNIDKQALREAANAANAASWGYWESYKPHKGARGYEVKVGVKAVAQHCLKVDSVFIAAANPATVLTLLDELEDYKASYEEESRDKEVQRSVIDDALCKLLPGCQYMDLPDGGSVTPLEQVSRMIADYLEQLQAAKKRIAELEAREVVLPSTQDVHPLGPQSAKIFCEFHRSIVNRCADEIRKVGVKVSIKGN
ncbi:TPA: ead/Ea22-like family protein [Escherichia coli]|nr:ead/Ea22-like family protein [Escherichia coli]